MGIILYEMMTGFIPFGYGMSDPVNIYNSILKDELNLKRISNKNGANLIKGLLERDPNKRISSPM
jgi:serine/threonine protein kinase